MVSANATLAAATKLGTVAITPIGVGTIQVLSDTTAWKSIQINCTNNVTFATIIPNIYGVQYPTLNNAIIYLDNATGTLTAASGQTAATIVTAYIYATVGAASTVIVQGFN